MKALMKEFSSYIAEVLKIIRNSKLLKKFKSFILRAQENEHEHELNLDHEHEHEYDHENENEHPHDNNMLTNGDLSNKISRPDSHRSISNKNNRENGGDFTTVSKLRSSAQI